MAVMVHVYLYTVYMYVVFTVVAMMVPQITKFLYYKLFMRNFVETTPCCITVSTCKYFILVAANGYENILTNENLPIYGILCSLLWP